VASAVGLFRSKWFAVGMLVALVAWVFHVAALALAPLSIVQAVIAGGLVFLTVLAERYFGCSVGTRQWAGVGLTALGLVLLAVTLPSHAGHSSYSVLGMVAFESALLALGTFLVLSKKLDSHEHHGVMLGTAAGILFGVSGTGGTIGMLMPWLVTCIAASVIAFYASARGLQKGEAVPVITLTSAAANVTAISGGILVFGDPMPGDPIGIVVQSFAFVLVIVAAALTPAPLRAARATA
jgi:drug/metabolite transporter (DMT)-like permease